MGLEYSVYYLLLVVIHPNLVCCYLENHHHNFLQLTLYQIGLLQIA
nr:MAG TPA: hypothetical protein [Caudoviricetes sp.]